MTPAELRTARASLGLTQAQLAEWLHLTRGQVVKLEAGDHPIKETLAELVRAYLAGYRRA